MALNKLFDRFDINDKKFGTLQLIVFLLDKIPVLCKTGIYKSLVLLYIILASLNVTESTKRVSINL